MTDAVVTQQQILEYRRRIQAGEELTEEELRSAWDAWRADRQTAASMATKSRSSKAAAPPKSTAELTALFMK